MRRRVGRHELLNKEFSESIQKALQNHNLAGILDRWNYPDTRAAAYAGVDFDALRDKIAKIKGDATGRLDELAEKFKKAAETRGAKVFRANSPQAAKDYITTLCKEKGVKNIVKSKSMATEEIHLNEYLAQNGIKTHETDLGEWIIQLAHQKPSHMVMPALHMTKEDVADLISKETKKEQPNDIQHLVKVARKELREKFFEADMGISGANIAIAETGTVVICTNEGNARLVATLPKIHLILVGLEKLIDNYGDAAPILTALPKSATSQLITCYVSMISGPAQNTDGSMKDLHIVLMDNKRTAMAKDPKFKDALQCIRCGSCLNVCPVYRLVTGHVFGHIYTGGIGTILTAWFDELKKTEDIQGLCIQCGRCKAICPAKIDIPELIVELRRRLVREHGLPVVQRAIYSVINNRRLFHSMLRTAAITQKPFVNNGFIRHLPMFLSDMTKDRSLPAIADVPFRDKIKQIKRPRGVEKASFYAGCLIDFSYPHIGEAVINILNKAGIEVSFPDEQTCCGAPARYSGAFDIAANNAIDNIKALLNVDVKYVVSACPTCTVALKYEFYNTLKSEGKTEWLSKARELAAKTVDYSTIVTTLVKAGRLSLQEAKGLGKVTYHDSCHLKRTLNVFEEPRTLLTKSGFELAEMPESDTCCGMGGTYTIKLPEISSVILKRKLENITKTAASTVAMDCPGCIMQIKGGLDKEGSLVKVKHTAELLAERLT
jgi:L-lactate dehydrogenase complex protein LldF